ncbi:acyltransferase family protein [Bradyrhizobium sp. McL0616]|uniref:acyltransferase family protein n=1 Tax=Bradyrhizobium sp. McL0616 TaxID=3415674 RepID=UPI003CE91EAF
MLKLMDTWRNPRLTGRILELDGIRGLAILLVLIWHYLVNSVQDIAHGSWQAYVLFPLRITWSGVDLFFVLSGFLIGGILIDEKYSKNYYRTFYWRRIYRIFPLYFLWLSAFLAGLYLVKSNEGGALQEIFNAELPVWSYALFLQNSMMAWYQSFGPKWMGITWSLAVEEQFYLLLPFLVRNLTHRGIFWLALSSILLAPAVRSILWAFGNEFFGPYVLLPSRADNFGFGILVALVCRNERLWYWFAARRLHIYVCLLILGGGFVFLMKHETILYTIGLTWIAIFYALLLLLTVLNLGGVEGAVFKNQILVKLGTLAYGIYIVHEGVRALLRFAVLGGETSVSNVLSLSLSALSFIIVFAFAMLSWRFMERPLIRRAQSLYRY